jgi:hypothetical protein
VKVRFIIDSSKINNAPIKDLINAGIPVLASRYGGGIMHNKFAIFDYRDSSSWLTIGFGLVPGMRPFRELILIFKM